MVAVIYAGIRYIPTYDLTRTVSAPADGSGDSSAPPVRPGQQSRTQGEPVKSDARPVSEGGVRTKEDVWATVLAVSVGGMLLVMAAGLIACWFLTRRLLAPLQTISQAAAKAEAGELHHRIHADGRDDELKQLADTFDGMLARIEESLAAHRRFAANASHELLTPLATTRAILQVTATDSSGKELAELAPVLRETNERNITIVNALLDLASADHAQFDPEPVDLAALAARTAAERTSRAESEGLQLTVEAEEVDCAVSGSSTLLRQLVLNLLDNALNHNMPGGSVHLAVHRDDAVVLDVVNNGTPVDEELVDRLFEPFYRPRTRLAGDRSGHGLGLAIVRSIAAAHHGTATAVANPGGGLTVRVGLPPHKGESEGR
ncbi:sensor histidine kinase [Streptoverticillium reticulum]|uniref:sensor histidine kinase n=1 Tax=Streptoverticillium reticulum TaxID=1433415 RepID=UPI0039BF268B